MYVLNEKYQFTNFHNYALDFPLIPVFLIISSYLHIA